MKVEIEISEELAHQLSYNMVNDSHDAPEFVPARVQEILARYGHWPEILDQKHKVAIAILRDKAVERAVQVAKPGSGAWEIEALANALLDAVIGK